MSDVISLQIAGLSEVLRTLEGENARIGVKRGLKKVGKAVETLATRGIRSEYNLKKVDVDEHFEVKDTDDSVLIICRSRPINLTAFGAKQYGAVRGKRVTVKRVGSTIQRSVRGKAGKFGGVSVPIKKTAQTLLPGAFITKVKAGNKGAFNIGVFRETSHNSKSQYIDPRNRRKTDRPYVMVNRSKNPRKAIINMAMKTVSSLFKGTKTRAAIDQYLQSDALDVVLHEIDWAMRNEK